MRFIDLKVFLLRRCCLRSWCIQSWGRTCSSFRASNRRKCRDIPEKARIFEKTTAWPVSVSNGWRLTRKFTTPVLSPFGVYLIVGTYVLVISGFEPSRLVSNLALFLFLKHAPLEMCIIHLFSSVWTSTCVKHSICVLKYLNLDIYMSEGLFTTQVLSPFGVCRIVETYVSVISGFEPSRLLSRLKPGLLLFLQHAKLKMWIIHYLKLEMCLINLNNFDYAGSLSVRGVLNRGDVRFGHLGLRTVASCL